MQLIQPTLEAGQRILRLAAVVNYDGRIGTAVVSAVQAAELLLAERVPDLKPADLSSLFLFRLRIKRNHVSRLFFIRHHHLHLLVTRHILRLGTALVEDAVAVASRDAGLAHILVTDDKNFGRQHKVDLFVRGLISSASHECPPAAALLLDLLFLC